MSDFITQLSLKFCIVLNILLDWWSSALVIWWTREAETILAIESGDYLFKKGHDYGHVTAFHFWLSCHIFKWAKLGISSFVILVHILTSTRYTYTHTHTHLTALFPGLPGWASTRKVKPIWILLKQETMSGSGISWAACKSAPCCRHITTPAPHHSVFLQAECPSCHSANSIKGLKADETPQQTHLTILFQTAVRSA